MRAGIPPSFQECNCLAIRQAARHVTQFYDQVFAPVGLRATQFAILSRLKRDGPLTITRWTTTLRASMPRAGPCSPWRASADATFAASPADRRRRELRLTANGTEKQRQGSECWAVAQERFDEVFGGDRAAALRGLLREVVASEFAGAA